jgi:hypothetical protein
MSESEEPKVAWRPLPGSQAIAISCPCHHILYEGTRGPGKTDAQLMYFRRYVGLGYGQFWRGIIFDREYKNLDDLVAKSQRWYPKFADGAKFHASKADYRWTWPTGEELLFRQVKKEADYWGYHGQEFPFIGWNELSKYPTSSLYDSMMSCNRTSFLSEENPLEDGTFLPKIPLVVFSTTNPYGAGHNWVKTRFIDVAAPGVVVRKTIDVFNPQTQQREPLTTTQVRIFGSYKENRYLDPKYVAELESIKDKNKRRAWLHGDWDIVAGGALDDLWEADKLVKPRFRIPAGWKIDRSMDWGSSHPFSIGWWAEANGEEVKLNDFTTWCPQKGSLIRIHEWYGTEEIGTNKGLKLSAKDVARGIKSIEAELLKGGWIHGPVEPGPADNQIFEVRERDTDSIAKMMESQKIHWTHSDKSPGSRKNGLQLMRDRLEASLRNEGPGLYFMDHCRATLSTLPVLPRDEDDPDDVDTDAEDHTYDDSRYRVLAGNNRGATVIPLKFVR